MARPVEAGVVADSEARLAEQAAALTAELSRPHSGRDLARFDAALGAFRQAYTAAAAAAGLFGARSGLETRERSAVHHRLRWARALIEALERLRASEPQPLYGGPPTAREAALLGLAEAGLTALHRLATPMAQSPEATAYGCFPDIALPPDDFHQHIHAAARLLMAAKRRRPWRFLDVGSGGGVKVLQAAAIFDVAEGLEYDPAYVAAAARLFAATGVASCRVVQGDALGHDGYGGFDVIYFYQPIRDDAKLQQMEARIAAQAAPGTVLIAAYAAFGDRAAALGASWVRGSLYLAGTGAEAAAALCDEAERMGVDLIGPAPASMSRAAYLLPLVEACRMNGHSFPVELGG